MKSKFSIILFLLAIAFTANSKPIESIIGGSPKDSSYLFITVIDSETHSALPFVSVIALYNNHQLGGGQTDFDGNVAIQIPIDFTNKSITIKAIYPAYKDKQITLTLNLDKKYVTLKMSSWARAIIDYVIYVPPSPAYRTTGWDKQTIRKGDTPFW